MAKVKVAELKAGMICGETVKGRGSMILVHTGTELSDTVIDYLQQWGLDEIEIFDGKLDENSTNDEFAGQDGGSIDSSVFEEAAKRFFQHTDIEHPAMEALFSAYLTKLVMEQVTKTEAS